MRLYILTITSTLIISCSLSTQNTKKSNNDSIDSTTTQPVRFKDIKLDPCETTTVTLDTATELQNQFFEPEKDLLGYKQLAVHVTDGDGEMGYAVLSRDGKLTLCLIDWQEGYKIIGAVNIPNLKHKETFVDFCESNCSDYFKTFGVVEEIKYGDVKTIRAWRVNDKTKQLEEIKPSAVSCIESFYTDTD